MFWLILNKNPSKGRGEGPSPPALQLMIGHLRFILRSVYHFVNTGKRFQNVGTKDVHNSSYAYFILRFNNALNKFNNAPKEKIEQRASVTQHFAHKIKQFGYEIFLINFLSYKIYVYVQIWNELSLVGRSYI